MAAYSPVLANGLADEPPRRAAPTSERSRLAAALKSARRALVDSGMLRRPTEASAGNFLRNTLRRLVVEDLIVKSSKSSIHSTLIYSLPEVILIKLSPRIIAL